MNKLSLGAVIAITMLLTACGGKVGEKLNLKKPTPATQAKEQPVTYKRVNDDVAKKKATEQFKNVGRSEAALTDLKVEKHELVLGKHTYANGKNVDLSVFGNGLHELEAKNNIEGRNGDDKYTAQGVSKVYLYQQDYSLVGHVLPKEFFIMDADNKAVAYKKEKDHFIVVKGLPTAVLPKVGEATYKGKAFSELNGKLIEADLEYTVHFGKRLGSGRITNGKDLHNITLREAALIPAPVKKDSEEKVDKDTPPPPPPPAYVSIPNQLENITLAAPGIVGEATSDGYGMGIYQLGFFGPEAQEVIGNVIFEKGDNPVGFGGKR